MNDHIQNILAERLEEFDEKFSHRWRGDGSHCMFEKISPNQIKLFLESSLTSTYTAGYEAGLEAAEKCVPEKKGIVAVTKKLSRKSSKQLQNDSFNSCRTLTLEAINTLRK